VRDTLSKEEEKEKEQRKQMELERALSAQRLEVIRDEPNDAGTMPSLRRREQNREELKELFGEQKMESGAEGEVREAGRG
jgi:hypothetical protein